VFSPWDSDAAPVDPPIPFPDVAGADASAGGLPRRVDLTLRQRLIVDSSAVADIALRTAIASLLSATMVPTVVSAALRRSESRAEGDHLRFYAELAKAQDPALSFPAPTDVPRVSSRPANPVAEWIAKGRTISGSTAASRRSTRHCATSVAGISATTSYTLNTGYMMTARTRRCV
jgi:hypothetical protein